MPKTRRQAESSPREGSFRKHVRAGEVTARPRRRRDYLLIGLILIAATLAVYWQALGHEFINLDDETYITDNDHVRAGLTLDGILWAFTAVHAANWHPLTWISHMLDCQVYKLDPMGHHLTNLLLHIANTLLLFLVLGRITGSVWRSGFVAALFAVHPVHVESVAWVAERKDVLSTFFWLLTMLAYVRYARNPGLRRYLPVVLLFALGLMAKPMLVTLPFVLLLLDYWPLGRLKPGSAKAGAEGSVGWKLLWEKLPLFAMSAASCVITYVAQQKGGAIASWERLTLGIRTANALVAYTGYMGKMLWPRGLAVFYPHPARALREWQIELACLVLACVFVLALRAGRGGGRHPYLAVGWLWYVITLVPVIGLVQVGSQAMADRYTYVPLIGLFVIIGWGVPNLLAGLRGDLAEGVRVPLGAAAGMLILALGVGGWFQVSRWRDAVTLFEHAIRVAGTNDLSHKILGDALTNQGRIDEAIREYRIAARLKPDYPNTHNGLGVALKTQGKLDEAIREYREAIRLWPDFADAHNNLGVALDDSNRVDEAIHEYRKAIRLSPGFAKAYSNLGAALRRQGRLDEAIREYRRAVRLRPDFAEAHNNLAVALYFKGDYAGAWREVHLCRKYGVSPNPDFIKDLSGSMSEPAR